MFREISVWHVVLILVAFMVLFGYKKLPDATRSLGRSMRIFKSEVKGLHDDDASPEPRTDAPRQVESPRAEAGDRPVDRAPGEPRNTEPRSTEPRSTGPESRVESDRA